MLNNSVKVNYINLKNVIIETVLISNVYSFKERIVFLSTIQNKNLTNAVKIFNIIVVFENFIYVICFNVIERGLFKGDIKSSLSSFLK